jgi:acyl-CoA thioester hydrolase
MSGAPDHWPITVEVPVAWGDMDAFGHVNNAVYLRWFETARIACFERIGLIDRMKSEHVGPILARAVVDYRRPVVYPDTVCVRTTVSRLGTTSFVLSYRVESSTLGGAVVAEGETVVVLLDYRTGAKVPLDEALRARIAELLKRSPAQSV